ncbi:MAG: hypothetical protein JWP29_2826 [Rhodoferax sp.]|nr:hypothetical protein [Rhodoferax sp.]
MPLISIRFFKCQPRKGMVALALGALLGMPVFAQSTPGTEALAAVEKRNAVDLALSGPERLTVADTVRGILGYARWPDESRPLRLCVTGRSAHGDALLAQGVSPLAQRTIVTLRVPVDADVASQCDALYVGELEEGSWRNLFSHIAGRPVLTICERSPICMIGGMFCLDVDATSAGVPFEVNLDSVARSGVRVNPQVLRLGRRAAKGTS